MASKYCIGQILTIRLGGFNQDEIFIKGVVEEVRPGNPPQCSSILPVEAYCYRFHGDSAFYRECCVVTSERPVRAVVIPRGVLAAVS
jgi:hypothetical protein